MYYCFYYYCYYYYDDDDDDVAHEMWCTTATTRTLFGVPGSLSARNNYLVRLYGEFVAIRLGCVMELMPLANVESKPWRHCGCTDDTLFAVSATQSAFRFCPGSSRGRNHRCNFGK